VSLLRWTDALVGDFADGRSLEQLGCSPEPARDGHANANGFPTRNGDRAALSMVLGIGPFCVESDEKRSHHCRIEHVGSPFWVGFDLDTPSPANVRASNTCRSAITIGFA
jgi:hypothetical protein